MKLLKIIFLIVLSLKIQNSWCSLPSFKITAGTKTIVFLPSATEWSDFCVDKKMGCARFKFKNEQHKVDFGFVKVISEKIAYENFNKYCLKTFLEIKNIDKNLHDYLDQTKLQLPLCSWSGEKDTTFIFWKEGLTIMVTASGKTQAEKEIIISMISEAKVHERP